MLTSSLFPVLQSHITGGIAIGCDVHAPSIESPMPCSRAASFSLYLTVSDILADVTMRSPIFKLLMCIKDTKENHSSEVVKFVKI